MSHMFHNCWSVTSFQKLNWNISNVTDMSFMFHNFPLQPFAFIHNFNFDQNVDHMFTPVVTEDDIEVTRNFHKKVMEFANKYFNYRKIQNRTPLC